MQMRIIICLTVLSFMAAAFGQNVAINADGSDPNVNAALDVSSPSTGDGKGLLIPRLTNAQRTTASAAEAGGLLDDAGDLRGGAAQGLLVYQTDGNQGFYYNISSTATPSWLFLCDGDAGSGLLSHERGGLEADVSAYDGILKISGGTTSAVTISAAGEALIDDASAAAQRTTLGLGSIATQTVPYNLPTNNGSNGQYLATNGAGTASWSTVTVPLPGTTIAIGDSAIATSNGVAIGVLANSTKTGTAIGYGANSAYYGAAFGYKANGNDCNVAIGYSANAHTGHGPYAGSVAIGYRANSFSGDGKYTGAVAIGYTANARHNFNENDSGAIAIGFKANSFIRGAGVGYKASGYNKGVAVGYLSTGSNEGVGIGYKANGAYYGTAIGYMSNAGNKHYSFAKGPYSKCTRHNEEWKSSSGSSNKYGYGQVNWHGTTTTGAPAREIYLGGLTNKRFVLQADSAVTFQILVTGINTDSIPPGNTSGWRIFGTIKRRSNTTALVGAVSIDAKTQGSLTNNPTVTADDTNEALKLSVTGVAGETVLWNAMMTYSEVRQ